MKQTEKEKEYELKFRQLNVDNQNYIIGIQQALIFAQLSEKAEKKK